MIFDPPLPLLPPANPPAPLQPDAPGAVHQQRVVLVVDMVESVRLMDRHESATVKRWCEVLDWVQAELLPRHHGQLVKSLGDGLLLMFEHALAAWHVAHALHESLLRRQWALPDEERIWLRAGLHCDWLYQHPLDVFGAAPNLAARLAALAGAGQTVCSREVWLQLREREDIQAEDLGPCWLKHLDEPVSAFRLQALQPGRVAQSPPPPLPIPDPQVLLPLLAVMPASLTSGDGSGRLLGDLLSQGLIERFARVPELQVVDALSSGLLGLGPASVQEGRSHLKADYVLTLDGRVAAEWIFLEAELHPASGPGPCWTLTCHHPVTDLFQPESELLGLVVEQVLRQLMRRAWRQSRHVLMPNLASHELMLAGIEALHGVGPAGFAHARDLFEGLTQRHPRLSTPRAWLTQWHVLSVTRGVLPLEPRAVQQATMQARLAVEHQPEHALAWAARSFVECHLQRDPEQARASVLEAIRLAPSQALAWLYRTTIESLLGHTADAYAAGQCALRLAPMGPLRYYLCCLAGHAALFDGRPTEAMHLLEESYALNPHHSPTLRMLVVAHHDLGQLAPARQRLEALRRLEPGLTVKTYLARSPGGHSHRARFAAAMAAVGLPRT